MATETTSEPVIEERSRPAHRRAGFDRRTILICVLVALVAAVASAVVAANLLSDDEDTEFGLSPAQVVPEDIPFTRFDGTEGTLADYAGQKLVLNFFASTCVPCRKEMPALEQIQREAGDEITVLGLAVRDDRDAALALVEQTGVTYDTAQDVTGDIMTGAGGTLLPFTLFVAPDGTIMERHFGELTGPELRDKISANLLAGG